MAAAAAMPLLRMAGTRLAPLLKGLGASFNAALPRGGEAVMEFAPNALFALSAAAMAPPETSAGMRAGIAAEDAVANFGLDMGLRMLGGPASRGLARMKGLKHLSKEGEMMTRGGISMLGSVAANMGGLVPRPFMNAAYDQYEQQATAEQQQQLALRDQAIREQVIREMGGYAPMAEPLISAGYGLGYGGSMI